MILLTNPITLYLKWLFTKKLYYEYKYRKQKLRIDYLAEPKNVIFGRYNWICKGTVIENSSMGDYSYISANSVVLETTIGKFCSIGPNVRIAPGKHPTRIIVSTHPAIYSNPPYLVRTFSEKDHHNPYRKVTIGNDVWIGANAIIADGVTIADGVIVAGNSLVNRDVPPYAIVIGNPAQIIKYRFEKSEIEYLLKCEWWNKDDNWIQSNIESFYDIKSFINYT